MKTKTSLILITAVLSLAILACLGSGQSTSSNSSPSSSSSSSSSSGHEDPLLGTGWLLKQYGGKDILPNGNQPTITFSGGLASGNSGCNGWQGEYTIDGTNLTFGELSGSEIFCENPAGIMEQEDAFLQMLGDAASYELNGDQLTIYTSSGEALVFSSM
ncbi:MAG: META domain-containing protein [Anaerolineales bacterium]